MGISSGNSCHCKADKADKIEKVPKSDNLFAPIKGRMKVLKKIKRRMGLAPRATSSSGGTNNLPPLLFHQIHGDNIRISRYGTMARRVESFCKGIAFSARPVKVNEKVCIRFSEISNNWSGVIRFGFTYNDPSTLRGSLPKYACPDLTNKPGYWAKALAERFCDRDTLLFYYVNQAGDVHFGINGEEKGIFFSGVETRGPLWALIDVYGNSTAIEFVDIRQQLNNSRRNVATAGSSCDNTPDDVDRLIVPSMQGMNIHESEDFPPLKYQPPQLSFNPVPFHRTRGRNVRFNQNRSVASRNDTEFCQGYVFTARPLMLNERIVVQILSTESMYVGSLALGLTSCDPNFLQGTDLPDDSDLLLDRPEYWVVSKDFASSPQRGDEISFCVTHSGEVQISKNGRPPSVVMHVDQTLKLWAFLDIYGSTQRIRVYSCPAAISPARNDRRLIAPSNSESMNSLNSQSELRRNSVIPQQHPIVQPSRVCCVTPSADMVQVQSSINGGAVLVVNLPASNIINSAHPVVQSPHPHSSQTSVHSQSSQHNVPHPSHHISQQLGPQVSHHVNGYPPAPVPTSSHHAIVTTASQPTGTMLSTCSNTYIEPVSGSTYSTLKNWSEIPPPGTGSGVECTICYENSIDCVLYMCGHMCMCYECAIQQWKGKGGGHCPLCRAVIRDVIRTYKS